MVCNLIVKEDENKFEKEMKMIVDKSSMKSEALKLSLEIKEAKKKLDFLEEVIEHYEDIYGEPYEDHEDENGELDVCKNDFKKIKVQDSSQIQNNLLCYKPNNVRCYNCYGLYESFYIKSYCLKCGALNEYYPDSMIN